MMGHAMGKTWHIFLPLFRVKPLTCQLSRQENVSPISSRAANRVGRLHATKKQPTPENPDGKQVRVTQFYSRLFNDVIAYYDVTPGDTTRHESALFHDNVILDRISAVLTVLRSSSRLSCLQIHGNRQQYGFNASTRSRE